MQTIYLHAVHKLDILRLRSSVTLQRKDKKKTTTKKEIFFFKRSITWNALYHTQSNHY